MLDDLTSKVTQLKRQRINAISSTAVKRSARKANIGRIEHAPTKCDGDTGKEPRSQLGTHLSLEI